MADDSNDRSDPLSAARAGELDTLAALSPVDAYKWLLVAADFGHEEALDHIGDLEEHHNVFKYDDDALTRTAIHLDLAAAYLAGSEGLPVDYALAERHLDEQLGTDVAKVRRLRNRLDEASRRFVDGWLEARPFRAVARRVDRLRHLHELDRGGASIPVVIIEAEIEALRAEVEALRGAMLDR